MFLSSFFMIFSYVLSIIKQNHKSLNHGCNWKIFPKHKITSSYEPITCHWIISDILQRDSGSNNTNCDADSMQFRRVNTGVAIWVHISSRIMHFHRIISPQEK